MGIQRFFGTGIMSNRATPCRGGAFNVRVLVLGQTNARAGAFSVKVFDNDPIANDLLAESKLINVPGGGAFRRFLNFTLDCDGACHVQGPKGSSGEMTAQVFARAIDSAAAGAADEDSRQINLTCVPPKNPDDKGDKGEGETPPQGGHGEPMPGDDGLWEYPCYPIPEHGGSCETVPGVTLDIPEGAVGPDTLLEVTRVAPRFEAEFFPGEIGMDMRTLQIGRFDTAFKHEIGVTWVLRAAERRLLDDLEGSLVQFDPEAMAWMPMEGVKPDDDVVSFRLKRGGVFAVASNARYNDCSLMAQGDF